MPLPNARPAAKIATSCAHPAYDPLGAPAWTLFSTHCTNVVGALGSAGGESSRPWPASGTVTTVKSLPWALRAFTRSLLRRRWPTLAGLGFAALIAVDLMSGVEPAPVLAASAAVYLGAAALQRPAAAWPLFFATAAVMTIARLLEDRFEPTWVRKCVMQLVGAHEALHQGGPVGARGLAQRRSLGWMPCRSRRLSKDPEGSTG